MRRLGARPPRGYATMAREVTLGRVALDRGEVRTSARLVRGVLPLFPGSRGGGGRRCSRPGSPRHSGWPAHATGARAALVRAEQARHPGMRCVESELVLAQAWVAAAEGDTGRAIQRALRAAELADQSGQGAVEVVARHAAVCFGDTGQAARLAVLAERVDGPRAPAAAAHARRTGRPRTRTRCWPPPPRLERAELVLLAADAAAQAATLLRARAQSAPPRSPPPGPPRWPSGCDGARTRPARRTATLPISARSGR